MQYIKIKLIISNFTNIAQSPINIKFKGSFYNEDPIVGKLVL